MAIKNTLNYYKPLSPNYAFSSSLRDLATDDVTLISIPSIFYGSRIRKNSVKLDFSILLYASPDNIPCVQTALTDKAPL